MGTDSRPTFVTARAPTRIDLAGGTVDLWPLFLFLNRPLTINLAIDLFAEVRLEHHPSAGPAGVRLRSEDQAFELELGWDALLDPSTPLHPALELPGRLLRHFVATERPGGADDGLRRSSLRIATRAKSPAGAGLGGSSTLNIALTGALASWARGQAVDPSRDGEKLIKIARDIETTVIQVPAGLQDYYAAMFGGLQRLSWGAGSHRHENLPAPLQAELEKRLLLFYSGQSRNSGINNWLLFKNFIDREAGVREKFGRISEATHALDAALSRSDWRAAGEAIRDEWATRRTLAPGISTPQMDQAFEAAARAAPVSGKVCGAGGGGCFFVYLSEPNSSVEGLVAEASQGEIRPLPFRAAPKGLEVSFSRG